MKDLSISKLSHTWLIDVDGVILKHNGYRKEKDVLLNGVVEFWNKIPADDKIILLSARDSKEKKPTLKLLNDHGLFYDYAIFNLPVGERILINDSKPKGLNTALAINLERDIGLSKIAFTIDDSM